MATRLAVSLTIEHIQRGRRGSGGLCPVALAIKPLWPEALSMNVSRRTTTVQLQPHQWLVIDHRPELQHWIMRFDGSAPLANMPEGTIVVNYEDGVDSMGNIHAHMGFLAGV